MDSDWRDGLLYINFLDGFIVGFLQFSGGRATAAAVQTSIFGGTPRP